MHIVKVLSSQHTSLEGALLPPLPQALNRTMATNDRKLSTAMRRLRLLLMTCLQWVLWWER
jgi:hypothetical protein